MATLQSTLKLVFGVKRDLAIEPSLAALALGEAFIFDGTHVGVGSTVDGRC